MNNRHSIAKRYQELLLSSKQIVESLDVRDDEGRVVETGSTLINRIMSKAREKKDISEAIGIIGTKRWNTLRNIWKELADLSVKDANLQAKT